MTIADEFAAARFYAERDQRTRAYVGPSFIGNTPITVRAGREACGSAPGQLLLSTLANLLSRTHRQVTFHLGEPDAAINIRSLVTTRSIGAEIQGITQRADPFGRFIVDHVPLAGDAVALSSQHAGGADDEWYLGVDRACASLDRKPLRVGSGLAGDARGAILAAILGAATVFKECLGFLSVPQTLSAWNLISGADADPGPSELMPIQAGRVLVAGAGAVAAGLAYCVSHWGAEGDWVNLDKDGVALHNTNRSLLFFPDDAGWPDGTARYKVDCLAEHFPNCTPDPQWYDQSAFSSDAFDTVLALANERNVRTLIARRNDPVQLQATTGRSWLSQLHRHVAGADDCLRCRMADVRAPTLHCSDGAVSTSAKPREPDAALPFLSVASGLMLASALQRLQEMDFWKGKHNTWRWDFLNVRNISGRGRYRCGTDCDVLLSAAARRAIAETTIWSEMI